MEERAAEEYARSKILLATSDKNSSCSKSDTNDGDRMPARDEDDGIDDVDA